MTIIAAADGSALGNPGPAGWAWYVDDDRWAAGGWPHATNNQGELMAVLDLFRATAGTNDDLLVLCDSQYVINSVTKWMPGWKAKGWRKGDGKPVMNVELLKEIDAAIVDRRYRFEWVKGHADHPLNEAADVRARGAAEAFQRHTTVPTGPGWPSDTAGGRTPSSITPRTTLAVQTAAATQAAPATQAAHRPVNPWPMLPTMGSTVQMKNPLESFPRPPFDVVDGEPKPTPDHGEETYVGHGRLDGRRVLITGGNSGIGRAVAIAFAREGADVAFTFHSDEEGARGTAEQIEKAGRVSSTIKLDAADEQACIDTVAEAASALGGLDTLVMVAGYQNNVADILDLSTEQLTKTFATNVFSLYWLTKAALAHIPAGGTIITTSSIQADQPSADKLDYSGTKAAIINFTKGLAQQLAPKGIRVNSVAPGPFWTNLQPDAAGDDSIKTLGENIPWGRPGQPSEIASTYVYLASDEASFTTGATILVAGGIIA